MRSFAFVLHPKNSSTNCSDACAKSDITLTLPSGRHTLLSQRTLTASIIFGTLYRLLIHTLSSMQETRFFHWTPALSAGNRRTRAH